MRTPWGQSDHEVELAPGITFYGTPSHGGIKLSAARDKKIPQAAREYAQQWVGGKAGWYEEDVAANIPWLVFFDEIKASDLTDYKHVTREMLVRSLEFCDPKILESLRAAGFVPQEREKG